MADSLVHRKAMAKRLAVLEQVRHELDELPDSQLAQIDDPVGLGHSMASVLSHHSGQYGQLVGPLYSDGELRHVLGIDSQELARRVSAGELLALPISGQMYFPAFQFHGRGVREDVLSVVRILRTATDPFTVAQWLCSVDESDPLGRTPLQVLDAGGLTRVLVRARQSQGRWSM